KVLLMPLAMPLRCGGTTPIAAEASDGLTSPTPAPATIEPASSAVQPDEGVRPPISSSPTPVIARPTPRRMRIGTREERLPVGAATKNETTVNGRNRSPVWSGE